MDPLDFAIYRFLAPDGEARFWAGRRRIDPTIPVREIAEKVHVSENAVRARIRGLERQGYLRGKALTPNPSLFGVEVHSTELPVKEPGEAERLFRDLALVDGVIFARDTLDEADRHLRVYFVSDRESTTTRRAALIHRLNPSAETQPPQRYYLPPCARELTPLDWRMLQALAGHPEDTITEIARRVGIGLKTAARRYHQLVESNACWWTHGRDSEEFPLAMIRVELREPRDREPIVRRILRDSPAWIPVATDGLGIPPDHAAAVIAGLVPADAPTVLERMVTEFGRLPGVVRVLRTFPLGSRTYPSWFADRLAERAQPRSRTVER